MKVKHLISDSLWMPNAGRDPDVVPAVSILLPTYCRGRDGLLQRAVRSVLEQELANFELIIIDDGSVDGTDDLIRELMAEDRRVHCIRHPTNVGLPAISMFEGYQRARADYLAFAFDDDVFTRDGLARLLEHAVTHRSPCVHGYSLYRTVGAGPGDAPRFVQLGRRDEAGHYALASEWSPPPHLDGSEARCLWKLHAVNFIGNTTFLVHRQVIEAVGLYDPHVVMIRSCDWDLWKRIAARFPIDYCDVQVSIENSDFRPDTLGQMHSIDFQRVVDYSLLARNEALVPSRFPEFDVTGAREGMDARLAAYAEQCLKQAQDRGRLRQLPPPSEHKKIVFLYDQGPSTHLLFHALPPDLQSRFYVHHGQTDWDSLWPLLINASAVVVCRRADLFAGLGIDAELRELDLPVHFYPADHPIPANLAELLPDLKGLLLPTEAGVVQARERGLGEHLLQWPLTCDRESLEAADLSPATAERMIVGVVGGAEGMSAVLLALAEIQEKAGVRLRVHAPRCDGALGRDRLEVVPVADERGWPQLVPKWQRLGIQVLLIAPGSAPESAFEGHAALLLACLIGAVPVVLDPRAWADPSGEHGVVRVGAGAGGLDRIVVELQDPARRAAVYDRLRAHCRTALSPDRAERAARLFLAQVPPVDVRAAEERWRRLERLRTRTIVAAHEGLRAWQARCRHLEHVASLRRREAGRDFSVRSLSRKLVRRLLPSVWRPVR